MPTIKQKKAAIRLSETIGQEDPPTKGEILLDAGFSPSTAKTPSLVFESKGFKQLLEEMLPDELLTERHKELLNKREVVKTFSHATGETEVELTDQPDTQAVKAALDMAYKLKGSYAAEKSINLNISADVKNPKALELAQKYEEELKQQLTQ